MLLGEDVTSNVCPQRMTDGYESFELETLLDSHGKNGRRSYDGLDSTQNQHFLTNEMALDVSAGYMYVSAAVSATTLTRLE